VVVEGDAPTAWAEGLARRGHTVRLTDPLDSAMGHAHAITVGADHSPGLLAGAADPRALIGAAAGY
jgi:gamma-glutamyltranspeptidase/glutathione hydrolase